MNRTELVVDNDPSSRLALAANILTIIVALLQLITLSAGLYQQLHVHEGEPVRSNSQTSSVQWRSGLRTAISSGLESSQGPT